MRVRRLVLLSVMACLAAAGWLVLPDTRSRSGIVRHTFQLDRRAATGSMARDRRIPIVGVTLAGTFSLWDADNPRFRMTPAHDGWRLSLPLRRDRYLYKYVLLLQDGRRIWIADPATAELIGDGFGGENSILDLADPEWVHYLRPIIAGLFAIAVVLLLVELLLRLFRRPGTRREHRHALVLAILILLAGAITVHSRIEALRRMAQSGYLEATGAVVGAFMRSKPVILPSQRQRIEAVLKSRFLDPPVYRAGGPPLSEALSLGGVIVFDREFRAIASVFRPFVDTIIRGVMVRTPLSRIFGALGKGGGGPVFSHPPREILKRLPAGIRNEYRWLGSSILLVALNDGSGSTGWMGFLLLPGRYAGEIRDAVYASLALFFTLLVLGVYLLLRRRPGFREAEGVDLDRLRDKYRLSEREREVLGRLVRGESYAEIGEALFISPKTAKSHVLSIYRKCGVRNRMALLARLGSLR